MFELEAFAKEDGEQMTLLRDGRLADPRRLPPGVGWHVRLSTPPRREPRTCRFEIFAGGLVGTTRFRWVRGD